MMNRGFDILPDVSGDIDYVLAESIASAWRPGGAPALFPAETYAQYVRLLKDARRQSRGLKIYTLDYWPASDPEGIRALYALQRRHGFIPYVAGAFDLQDVTPEPE